ncbi:MAG: hypothetical protein JXJ17_16485 [Anaerolineae bacterium]|nr:hypothetical protein [Anaerolineae bacterium]
MNIAYIIAAHHLPEQLVRLVDRLDADNVMFLIHINRLTEDVYQAAYQALGDRPNVAFIKRHKVHWGDNGLVRAVFSGFEEIYERSLEVDYALNLSGQDYPIKSNRQIVEILTEYKGHQLMEVFPLPRENRWGPHGGLFRVQNYYFWMLGRKFQYPPTNMSWLPHIKRQLPHGFRLHGGSAWACYTRDCIDYLYEFGQSRIGQDLLRFFDHTFAAPEMFFQTVLMSSSLADTILHKDMWEVQWEEGSSRPTIWVAEHLDILKKSDRLFARKFDPRVDTRIMDLLDEQVLEYAPR